MIEEKIAADHVGEPGRGDFGMNFENMRKSGFFRL